MVPQTPQLVPAAIAIMNNANGRYILAAIAELRCVMKKNEDRHRVRQIAHG
jgi:hypothetical protein